MTLETRPRESTNGRAHFYIKKKVDSVELVLLGQGCQPYGHTNKCELIVNLYREKSGSYYAEI